MSKSFRYDADEYLEAYRTKGQFPLIHEPIAKVMREVYDGESVVMDLGASIGVLAARLIEQLGAPLVVAIEPRHSATKSVLMPKICWVGIPVNRQTFAAVDLLVKKWGVKYVVARRVFPEIEERGGDGTVRELANVLADAGVEKIVLEGRFRTKRATSSLPNADAEVSALSDRFSLDKRANWREVRYLTRK